MLRLQIAAVLLGALSVAAVPALVVYPAKGQSAAKQSKDRGECDRWAVEQTGIDPALDYGPAKKKGTALKAGLGGAAVGGIVGSFSADAGKGAAVGGLLGAAAGGIRQHNQNAKAEEAYDNTVRTYNKAVGTCLTGRGYTVQ